MKGPIYKISVIADTNAGDDIGQEEKDASYITKYSHEICQKSSMNSSSKPKYTYSRDTFMNIGQEVKVASISRESNPYSQQFTESVDAGCKLQCLTND